MNLKEFFGINKISRCDEWIYQFNDTTDDFIDLEKQTTYLKKWLSSSNMKTGLIITGPTGCGKTSLCIMSCLEENIIYYIRDATNRRSKKDLHTYYQQLSKFKNSVLILDDMDIINNGTEIISLTDIQKWLKDNNETHDKIKIIFIISSSNFKKFKDIVKSSDVLKLDYPSLTNFYRKCKKLVNYKITNAYIKHVVNYFHFEPRSIFNFLINDFDLNTIESVNIEHDMFDSYESMFMPYSFSEKSRVFYKESGTIPIILQENYIDWKINNKVCYEISNKMSQADIFHKGIFSNSNNIFTDVYMTISVLSPISILKSYDDKTKYKRFLPVTKPRFGLLWTKQSAMYQKIKFIHNIEKSFNNSPMIELSYLYNIRKQIEVYLSLKDITMIKDLMQHYNLDNKQVYDLFSLFNIDDTSKDKKKQIKSLLKF